MMTSGRDETPTDRSVRECALAFDHQWQGSSGIIIACLAREISCLKHNSAVLVIGFETTLNYKPGNTMDCQGGSHRQCACRIHGKDPRCTFTDVPGAVLGDKHTPDSKVSQEHLMVKLRTMNPAVDPSAPTFDFDLWSRTIASLRAQMGVTVPPRSGFSFQNLTIRGSGSTVAYQDTVWTWFTLLFDLRRRLRKQERQTILDGLDGVLHKGELLLVLGLPGSGCTTFLKTITGQTHDLDLDPDSILEYRGKGESLNHAWLATSS